MPISQIIFELFEGLLVSVQIFGITLLFSLPFGLVVALGRMSKNTTISTITKVYISIMRGTPLMLQLFVVYYGPYYLFNIKLNPTYRNMAVYIGFIINYAAYFAEIYRSGIQSMPVGQYEAAEILGYSRLQTFSLKHSFRHRTVKASTRIYRQPALNAPASVPYGKKSGICWIKAYSATVSTQAQTARAANHFLL